MDVREFIPKLQKGTFIAKEQWLESQPLPSKHKCYILGKFDLLVQFGDGTYGVIDLKITEPKKEDLVRYQPQLHAYKFAFEHPVKNEPIGISKMGLLIISPGDVVMHKGRAVFHTKPYWVEFKPNMEDFYNLQAREHYSLSFLQVPLE